MLLDPLYFEKDEVAMAGAAGVLLDLRARCFSTLLGTGGEVNPERAEKLAREALVQTGHAPSSSTSLVLVEPSISETQALIDRVVDAGLWLRTASGDYAIQGYAQPQWLGESETEEERKREGWREQKRRQRRRRRLSAGQSGGHSRTGPPDTGVTFPPGPPQQENHSQPVPASSVSEFPAPDGVQPKPGLGLEDAHASETSGTGTGLLVPGSITWCVAQLADADDTTGGRIATVMRKYLLPEAALHAALEEMREFHPHSPARFIVHKLKVYGEEGRYAA